MAPRPRACAPRYSAAGTSSNARVSIGLKKARVVHPSDLLPHSKAADGECSNYLRYLSLKQRERYLRAEKIAQSRGVPDFLTDIDMDESLDDAAAIPPPGEEGFGVSNAGGEYAAFKQLYDGLASTYSFDERDCSFRVADMVEEWSHQYEVLTDAYLSYEHNPPPMIPAASMLNGDHFELEVIGIFERTVYKFPHASPHVNVSLLRYGCIGTSAIRPVFAVSVRTLEVYCQMHHACPQFTIHVMAKALCYLHAVHFCPYFAEQLRVAYDVYLEIQRHVDSHINAALGHDTPHWRVKNSCPACHYKLQDEPPLPFMFQIAMDGNNSAKCVDPSFRPGHERKDLRDGRSSVWIKEDEVDRFKDEVRRVRALLSQPDATVDPDDPWVDEPEDETEPANVCIDRWRNAAPEARKKMFAVFRKSGIFISVCRHGFLLTICDMIRSGELMKYPLATISRLMDIFPDNFLYGYDIHCAFTKILLRCSLGPTIRARGIDGVVPSFHGHAHNHLCQVQHHPKYKLGAGKEDFETCEQVFSVSNAVTSQIRNATDFHRHQVLEEHFKFADLDRYAALGTFLYNNYVQCLTIVDTAQAIPQSTEVADIDFDAELCEECDYLFNAHRTESDNSVYIDYVKALGELEDAKHAWQDMLSDFNRLDFRIIHDGYTNKDIAEVRRWRTNAHKRLELKIENVESFEARLNIETRWGAAHPERVKFQERLTYRHFFKAAEEVERLVVMCLLELTKLQMSNLGYKLRMHISKALKSRVTAIRNAIDRYNRYALELNPPRQLLQWEQIVDYAFLGEFELLRGEDIGTKRWAHATFREVANLHFDAERAREELVRCNVEIAWLCTKIRDDALKYPQVIHDIQTNDPPLAHQIERQWQYIQSVNAGIMARLHQIKSLDGYTGSKDAGQQEGAIEHEGQGVSNEHDGDLYEDRMHDEESALVDFFSTLHMSDT